MAHDDGDDGDDGDDAREKNPRYDVVLASDVLYDEASAAPLAGTLRDLLAPTNHGAERKNARCLNKAVCFLAWRPRAASPNKASAVRAFLAACAARRLRVREAPPEGKKTASAAKAVLRASDASNATRGWVESLTARDAAERGVRVLRIEAVEEGYA